MRKTKDLSSIIYLFFFLSGMTGLIYEIVWVRLIKLIMGGSTLAVTTVLAAFMGGLALGSYIAGIFIDRRSDALRICPPFNQTDLRLLASFRGLHGRPALTSEGTV